MAQTAQDYIAALQSYHPDVDLSGFNEDAVSAANNGTNVSDFVTKNINDPRVYSAYVNKYTQFAQPSLSNINNQIGIAQQQGQLGQSQTQQAYGNAAQDIQQGQYDQNQSLFNQADQMGLSRSGVTSAATGRIAANTQRSLSFNDAQRANSLASLALQTAGNVGQLQGQQSAITADIGQQARQDAYNNSSEFFNRQQQAIQNFQNINYGLLAKSPAYASIVSNVLQKAGLGYLDPTQLMQSAAAMQTGSTTTPTVSPVTTTHTNPTTGTTYSANTVDRNSDLSQALTKYFQSGGWQGKDSADLQDIASRYGVSPDIASKYYYNIRKSVVGQ